MALTKNDVFYVAGLARLAVNEEEAGVYAAQLQRILGYVEKLSELDTTGVPAASTSLPMHGTTREDAAHRSVSHEDALKNAPSVERGCFKVPQVIE